MYSVILAGLSLGLISNFHCIGMCGPLALAVPVSQHPSRKYIEVALYQFGRIITYTLLGVGAGMFSTQLSAFGLQQKVSMICGVLLLIYVVCKVGNIKIFNQQSSPFAKFISAKISKIIFHQSLQSKFLLGSLNGLLPCGLVYIALASSLAWGSWYYSVLYMACFGLGTLPALAFIMLVKNKLSFSFRHTLNRSIPYFVGILGLILILRGMNLGIPYLSPKLNDKHSCCERVAHHNKD